MTNNIEAKTIEFEIVIGVEHAKHIQMQLFSLIGPKVQVMSLTPIGTNDRSGYLSLFLHEKLRTHP
jgi:hypothetical protein